MAQILYGKSIWTWIKKRTVLWIAIFVAAATCFFVPFDKEYANYFDWQTVACLFCTMAVVGAFKNIRLFEYIACVIVQKCKTVRLAVTALVLITYVGSMVLANDMALLTFLPLSYLVLNAADKRKYLAFSFVMQNVAANLGGMLTPFGNPQNLYLFSYFNIPTSDFFAIMAPSFCAALILIVVCCFLIRPEPISLSRPPEGAPKAWRTGVYTMLFVVSVMIVFRVFPYYWGVAGVSVALLILNPRAFVKVDYALLLTFCAFFVFAGNLARIPSVVNTIAPLVAKSPFFVGILSCQFISNVPSAVLLSRFTSDYAALLPAVNIGGLGTLIASLASLITFNEYRKQEQGKTGKYLLLFTLVNVVFIAVLIGVQYFVLYLSF